MRRWRSVRTISTTARCRRRPASPRSNEYSTRHDRATTRKLSMTSHYEGKRVLITGGTGSFGHTVARKLLKRDVAEVRIFSRDEAKQDLMRHELSDSRARFYVGDVRDYDSVDAGDRGTSTTSSTRRPSSRCPRASSSRWRRSARTSSAARTSFARPKRHGVNSLVCLSTDKAVYPVNAMGMTKAMMEKVAQSHGLNNPNADTIVSCVRYGNVMYSRGSVIPLFIRQLRAGKTLTITNPDDDAVHDVAGGLGRSRRVRVPQRAAGRPLHPQGAVVHDRRSRPGRVQPVPRRRRTST